MRREKTGAPGQLLVRRPFRQEIFYQDYFEGLAAKFPNFHFHLALSAPLPEDNWTGHRGLHPRSGPGAVPEIATQNLRAVEFYLCGPPQMIAACLKMLGRLGVADSQIAYDEF